jgi:hypothetical protein
VEQVHLVVVVEVAVAVAPQAVQQLAVLLVIGVRQKQTLKAVLLNNPTEQYALQMPNVLVAYV